MRTKIQDVTLLEYRPDIDGIRAFAVLSVLFYHAFPKYFPSGFIGVDVFFVISGYLITGIIVRDNKFSFKDFYIKRIRRIFPTLILTISFSIVAGWFFLMPVEFKNMGYHVFAAAGFWSNFLLLSETGYFDTISETKPMLHLWSLAIEEQFYLVWPLIIFFAGYRSRMRIIVIGAVVLISFIASVWLTYISPGSAFYLPLSRFWEIGIGGGFPLAK